MEFRGPNGEVLQPEQIQQLQQQIAADAAKHGITVQEYVERLKAQAMAQHQARQEAEAQAAQQQQQAAQQQQQPINPGPPKPEALAVANFLRTQDLKPRTCVFQETKKEMFKVKRALRALQTPAYEKARQKKNSLLPPVTDRESAENVFKLLPLSLLALRVSKIEPEEGHEGHSHGKKKRVKGQWTVRIEQQQDARDEYHYIWLYEGSQWRTKLYAAGALAVVVALTLFPLWPLKMRQGVWYLSMGMVGLIGLFFAMAMFRLVLFCVTVVAAPPGLWLYPNLFEDVGFFDSFRPLWGWQETAEDKKAAKAAKKAKKAKKSAKQGHDHDDHANGSLESTGPDPNISAPITAAPGSTATESAGTATQRKQLHASVEEAEDD